MACVKRKTFSLLYSVLYFFNIREFAILSISFPSCPVIFCVKKKREKVKDFVYKRPHTLVHSNTTAPSPFSFFSPP